jgi:hypothetical protein
MGMELVVPRGASQSLTVILEALAAAGIAVTVIMIDGGLQAPGGPLPPAWRDVRLRAAEGTVTLARRGADVAVVVFGNADPGLRALQARIAAALAVDL